MKYKTIDKYKPYEISVEGEIRNSNTLKVLSKSVGNHGYEVVSLKLATGSTLVHRILCEVWLDNPANKEQVNHIDGIKTNNTLSNLEWCTRSENMIHAARNNLLTLNCKHGEECNLAHHSEDLIIKVCDELQSGMRNIDVMRKYNVSKDVVKDLKAGNTWKHITKDYNFPTRKGLLSEDTVRWVCTKIVEGFSNSDILKLSSSGNLKLFHIKNIKYKTSYTYISKEYF